MLTIYCASLENALTSVIQRLLSADETTAKCIGTSVDKLAGRAALVQRLVLRPGESPNENWRECMLCLCDQIANVVGPKRNRLVHDDWNISEQAIERHNPAIRIGKPSEREAKALLTYDAAPSHAPEIWHLTSTVIDIAFYLTTASIRYDIWKRTGRYRALPERAIRVSRGLPPDNHPRDA